MQKIENTLDNYKCIKLNYEDFKKSSSYKNFNFNYDIILLDKEIFKGYLLLYSQDKNIFDNLINELNFIFNL